MADEVLSPGSLAGLTVGKPQIVGKGKNILIYAESGWGKTRLGGSAQVVEGMSPVLDIDAEGGSETLKYCYPDVDVVQPVTWQQTWDLYSAIFDQASRGVFPYKTILLDSLVEYQKYGMLEIMQKVVAKAEAKGEERDLEVPSKREYLINLEQMRRVVRGFRNLKAFGVSTIFTCLASPVFEENTGKTKNKLGLTGKFQNEAPAIFDYVLYGYIREFGVGDKTEMRRLLLTKPTDTTIAKDRSGKLDNPLVNPTMQDIWKVLSTVDEEESENGN